MAQRRIDDEAATVELAIRHLFKNALYTDFKFISKDNREFHAHKLILAIHSPVLYDMLYESSPCSSIRIEDVDEIAIMNILSYFYGEDIVVENISHILDTKKLADRYQIIELCEICKIKFRDIEINITNVISVLKAAIQFGNEKKEAECYTLISENKETIFESEAFLRMEFENVLQILQELIYLGSVTEAEYLRSAIKWMKINNMENKKSQLMQKIDMCKLSMNEFIDIIISFEDFFSSRQISFVMKGIKCKQNLLEQILKKPVPPEGVNGTELCRSIGTNTVNEVKSCKSVETSTETSPQSNHEKSLDSEDGAFAVKVHYPQKVRELSIISLEDEDGNNVYRWIKRVSIKVRDDLGNRGFQVEVCDRLSKGIIGFVSKENIYIFHNTSDIDISYEGIYYMVRYIKNNYRELTPIQYIEVLKAISFFGLEEEFSENIILKLSNIVDDDPVFLEGLRRIPSLEDRCRHLLSSEVLNVVLHPNYLKITSDLLFILLEQDELYIPEIQLLIFIIKWLEAENRNRWNFRFDFLSKIAFENISGADIKYAIKFYPNFFSNEETVAILEYKNAAENTRTIKRLRKNLPIWYNFKSRKFLDKNG